MLPCTTALFSSGVPAWRLLDANLGISDRVMMNDMRPLGPNVTWPRGLGPNKSLFLPSCSSVTETSVHVPTRFLAVVCAAISLGRKTPKIRADVVIKGKMKRFMGDPSYGRGMQPGTRDGT